MITISINVINEYKNKLSLAIDNMDVEVINSAVDMLWNAYENDKQIFVIGNGGSASTASHIACDIGKGVVQPDKKRFRIQSLTDNLAWITAIANDISYDSIFEEQLKNFLNEKDIVIAISASGNSANVVKAVEFAKNHGAIIIGMTGFSGGKIKELADVKIHADLNDYGQAEDFHLICEHIMTECIRRRMRNER